MQSRWAHGSEALEKDLMLGSLSAVLYVFPSFLKRDLRFIIFVKILIWSKWSLYSQKRQFVKFHLSIFLKILRPPMTITPNLFNNTKALSISNHFLYNCCKHLDNILRSQYSQFLFRKVNKILPTMEFLMNE